MQDGPLPSPDGDDVVARGRLESDPDLNYPGAVADRG